MKSKKSNDPVRQIRKLTWKAFLVGGLVSIAAVMMFLWIRDQSQEEGIPWVLRTNFELNAKIWSRLFNSERLSPKVKVPPPGTAPRRNGNIGLSDPIDLKTWRLSVYVEDHLVQKLSMENIKWLPRTDTSTQFFCIEGWSTTFSYAGVKFSEFMQVYGLSKDYRYVGLETPDGEYYVSIDMDSMLHPQTLLAYEMNERSLSSENGAPLRLIIPIKYGIKNLKRIGDIRFSNTRPPDYWAEHGYDWYAGL